MRKLLLGVCLMTAALVAAPQAARAGFIIEGSLGKGVAVSPEVKAQETNVMVAPGLTVLSLLQLQLGLVAELPDVKASNFDFELRPMVTINPPILPLYGRVIFAFTDLLHSEERTFAYGAALGLEFGLAGLGIFAEAGLLPRSVEDPATSKDKMWWVIEGRAGLSFAF